MNTVPKLEHVEKAIEYMGEPVGCNPALWFIGVNKRINEIALAEQQENKGSDWYNPTSFIDKQKLRESQQESEYITAAQARTLFLDGGSIEFFGEDEQRWFECGNGCRFFEQINGKPIKYRTIKQAQPEPVDPYAALRAEYAKQVKEGTTRFYLWEHSRNGSDWIETPTPDFSDTNYRYTDISCYVSKDGEPAIRMLRTEAQELQAELGDTVDWSHSDSIWSTLHGFMFAMSGVSTYRTKPTIKLDGNMVTPEQAAAEWGAKKETCDLWFCDYSNDYRLDNTCLKPDGSFYYYNNQSKYCYELRPKQPTWTGSREDVIALLKEKGLL
jgi:hypothetical protein